MQMFKPSLIPVSLLTSILIGCGGDATNTNSNNNNTITQVPELTQAQLSLKPLAKADADDFINHYKNGLYLTLQNGYKTATSELAQDAASGGSSGDYSQTITQETDVDEADRVKYNGDYLYVGGESVRILKRNSDHSLTEVSSINSGTNSWNYANELYLQADNLAVISNQNYYSPMIDFALDIWFPYSAEFNISLYDVAVPEQPSEKSNYKIDGQLIASRVVQDKLILVSSYTPYLDNYYWPATTSETDALESYKKIQALNSDDILPKIRDKSGQEQNLVEADQCYLPVDHAKNQGYDAIVTLTYIDLNSPSEIESRCINASVQGLYASSQSFYLYGSLYNGVDGYETVIHHFADDLSYLGSANVPGHTGWQNSHLRFSEYNNALRVVTTQQTSNESDRLEHHLSVLQHDADTQSLKLISALPNESRPQAIGKPNEDVYAVRYFGERAYIVTFERIDPLYVVDLSNINDPKVAGELEVTGFSSYLHPIGENLLLGIGQEVDVDGNPNGNNTQAGAKVSLFDVSDPNSPKELGKQVFVGAHTPVEYDYHALTTLTVSQQQRFALPLYTWQDGYSQSLALLNVTALDGSADLTLDGTVKTSSDTGYGSDTRSILHGDLIYYINGQKVWQSLWSSPHVVNGPF